MQKIYHALQTYWILYQCNATVCMFRRNDGPNIKLLDYIKLVGTGLSFVCCLVIRGSTGGFHLLWYFSGIVFILIRLKPQAEEIIAEEQAGFRAGRSTTEQIFNLRILCEKYFQHQQNLYHVLIDLKKSL